MTKKKRINLTQTRSIVITCTYVALYNYNKNIYPGREVYSEESLRGDQTERTEELRTISTPL